MMIVEAPSETGSSEGASPCHGRFLLDRKIHYPSPFPIELELESFLTQCSGASYYPVDHMNLAPSFLDPIVLNGHRGKLKHPCSKGGIWGANAFDGKKFPLPCNRLECGRCIEKLIKWRQIVLANSLPERIMTLTMVASIDDEDPWQVARIRVKRFMYVLRKRYGYCIEYSFVVEKNPKGTGYHAHFLLKGDYLKQSHLKDASIRSGCGTITPWIKRLKWGDGQAMAGYGLKGFAVAGYGLKTFNNDTAAEARRLNGGRLEHHSRGFLSVEGRTVVLPEALAHAKRQLYGERIPQPLMLFLDSPFPFTVVDGGVAWDPYTWAVRRTDMNIDQIKRWYHRHVHPSRVVSFDGDGYAVAVDWGD